MEAIVRWSGIAIGLGLCTAYAFWGGTKPAAKPSATAFKPPFELEASSDSSSVKTRRPTRLPPSALKLSPAEVDFGEVPGYEKRVREVAVQNPGSKPVTISEIVPGCGCLKVAMKQKTIAPGQSENAEISFYATPREWKGELTAAFNTQEPGQAVLKCKGIIRQEFPVEPAVLKFGPLHKKESQTLQAVIKHYQGVPFKIKRITSKNAEFKFKWEAVAGSKESAYTIFATATGQKAGYVSDDAAIVTDSVKVPIIALGLDLQVAGDVSCVPGTVWSQQAAENESEIFETTVRRLTPGPLEIKKVTDARGNPIEFFCQPIDEGNQRLKLKPGRDFFAKHSQLGKFLIYNNVEEQPAQLSYYVKLRQKENVK
jgi:hypothetical protein